MPRSEDCAGATPALAWKRSAPLEAWLGGTAASARGLVRLPRAGSRRCAVLFGLRSHFGEALELNRVGGADPEQPRPKPNRFERARADLFIDMLSTHHQGVRQLGGRDVRQWMVLQFPDHAGEN